MHRRKMLALCGIVLGAGVWLAGCGGDDGSPAPPAGPSGPFTGAYVDSAGFGGVVTFTIAAGAAASPATTMLAPSAAVTGTVQTAGGGTVDLSGAYDAAGVNLRDANFFYQFQGTLQADGHFQGISITPGGNGAWAAHAGDAATVPVLCGTYSRCTDVGCSLPLPMGSLILIVEEASASLTVNAPDGPVVVAGTVTSGSGQVTVSFDFGQIHADGDLTGSSAMGTWSDSGGSGDTGIWSASSGQCPLSGR